MKPIGALARTPSPAGLAAVVAVAAGGAALAASLRFGAPGLFAPLAALGALGLLQRPRAALAVLIAVVVFCEGDGSGFVPSVLYVYEPIAAGVSAVDLVLGVVVCAAALELLRRREPVRLPALLTLPLALVALASVAGAVTGYAGGVSPVDLAFAGRSLAYLVLLPVLTVNIVRTREHVLAGVWFMAALAVAKAVLGLLALGSGQGQTVEGSAITYYEPVANLLMLLVLAGLLAVAVLRVRHRVPLWLLVASPLLLASLALSFRRSFWIGLVLALVLVVALGLSPLGRRMLVPAAALAAVGIWALGSVGFQTQGPIVERVESLRPSQISANAEDRYRLDERANVLAELAARPISGLGLGIGWSSAARGLPVEHENGRQYVHTVALWHWLKLGLLGLAGYLALLAASLVKACRIWRRHPDALLRACGLGAFCGLVAFAVVETTGSFTGVESRVSIALGALSPGEWSLDDAFDFTFPFEPGTAFLISALVGIVGTAGFLAAFWRPPAKKAAS